VFADLEIYRTVLESMQTRVYLVDCDQTIQFWNDGAEIITGHLRQNVVGHFCRDFFRRKRKRARTGFASWAARSQAYCGTAGQQ
jgi:PAS domain S-box-containing protein